MYRQSNLLQGIQQRFQTVGKGNGGGGIGQQKCAGDQHYDPGAHKQGGLYPLPGDGQAPEANQYMFAPCVKQIQHSRKYDHNDHGFQAPEHRLRPDTGKGDTHHQKSKDDAIGNPSLGNKQGHNIQHRHQQLGPGIQPVHHRFAREVLAQGNVL